MSEVRRRSESEPHWLRRRNHLKERLAAGEPALLMWQTLACPEVVEMLGETPLDAVIFDLEHSSYGLREVEALIRSADAVGLISLVRPSSADRSIVARILDAGAYGIVFPMIQSADDAARAVSCMRYAPRGARGWGGAHTRHARWQVDSALSPALRTSRPPPSIYSRAYVEKSEADLLTILIVETQQGVDAIDEIVTTEGVDGVIFGRGDFSLEAGFDASRTHGAAAHVFERCRAAGVGCALTSDSDLKESFFAGSFYLVGIDSLIISSALVQAVANARRDASTIAP
jgi:2-keto-3-deoxy-L-rhamnonate aldolase RhmA